MSGPYTAGQIDTLKASVMAETIPWVSDPIVDALERLLALEEQFAELGQALEPVGVERIAHLQKIGQHELPVQAVATLDDVLTRLAHLELGESKKAKVLAAQALSLQNPGNPYHWTSEICTEVMAETVAFKASDAAVYILHKAMERLVELHTADLAQKQSGSVPDPSANSMPTKLFNPKGVWTAEASKWVWDVMHEIMQFSQAKNNLLPDRLATALQRLEKLDADRAQREKLEAEAGVTQMVLGERWGILSVEPDQIIGDPLDPAWDPIIDWEVDGPYAAHLAKEKHPSWIVYRRLVVEGPVTVEHAP